MYVVFSEGFTQGEALTAFNSTFQPPIKNIRLGIYDLINCIFAGLIHMNLLLEITSFRILILFFIDSTSSTCTDNLSVLNIALSDNVRLDNLLSLMTIDEKVNALSINMGCRVWDSGIPVIPKDSTA